MKEDLNLYLSGYIYAKDKEEILSQQTRQQMASSLASFVDEAIEKFIKGQKEHGGNLADRNLDHEIRMETIDFFWYQSAKDWKK